MSRAGRPATARWLERACLASPLVAIAALAWSLRGAPLGTPVADDFDFIHGVVFHAKLDFFDSMGASYYWRPLSRQVWFSLVTPLLLTVPGVVAGLHVAILGLAALLLGRIARGFLPSHAAALVGAAVLASEPARALITWPSGIQHLLAALALALTAHEAYAGRRWSATLAAVAAALSHELGAAAFALVALGGVRRGGRGRAAWVDAMLGAGLAAGYALGYRTALAHGVRLPAGGIAGAVGGWFETLRHGLVAAVNAETLPATLAPPVAAFTGILVVAALAWRLRRPRRIELRPGGALLGTLLALGALGLLPLGALLPDWNAWRAFVPVLAWVCAMTLAIARVHTALGLAIVVLRVAALALAQPAGGLTGEPPAGASDLSFPRLARLQTVLAGSEPHVRGAHLGRGARVAYWGLPAMTMNGFRNSLAIQVWARDTTVRFVAFTGREAIDDPAEVVLAYDTRQGRPPVHTITADALRYFSLAMKATDEERDSEARDGYRRALAAQHPESPSLSAQLLRQLAIHEVADGRYAAADSLNRLATQVRGVTPDGFAIDALIAIARGDLARARRELGTCLGLDPNNSFGRYVQEEYDRVVAAGRAAPPTAR